MRYRPLLLAPPAKAVPNGRRSRAARLQGSVARPNSWRSDDAYDPRVVSFVVGPDGCAHAGADVRGWSR